MFKPKYTITHPILNNLINIAETRSLVAHTPVLPRQELKLRREAMIRMIHSSTSIEGNILNRYEVEKVLAGEKVDAPKRDIAEVKNYRDALYYITKFIEKKQKITIKTILEKSGRGKCDFFYLRIRSGYLLAVVFLQKGHIRTRTQKTCYKIIFFGNFNCSCNHYYPTSFSILLYCGCSFSSTNCGGIRKIFCCKVIGL